MIVIITGASAGIGAALARRLAARGAKLVLSARRVEKLEALNGELGGGHFAVRADVANPADCQELIRRSVEHYRRIDTLVCNAGYGVIRPVAQMPLAEMQAIFQTNVFGTTECVRHAVPVMQGQELRDGWRGQIVIVSSAAGRRGLPYFGAYSATKAAQLSLAEALRVELRPAGIAVTSVHPIGTDTDFFTTAEQVSDRPLPSRPGADFHQSASTVARKMVTAIERPRAELWPFRPARWALSLATLVPSLADRFLAKHRDELASGGDEAV